MNDLPGGNWTGINYAIDDFETASDMTYDLSQTSITTLHDISRISLAISHWDDAVCLRDLQLKVNGQVAFMKVWGNTPSTCKWLGGSNGPQSLLIDRAELRASSTFAAFTNPQPSLVVPADELASRLESTVGSLLFGSNELVWREVDSGYGVQVTKKANVDNVLHVKLPLEGLVDDLPNPDIDIDFNLTVGFVQNGTQWELHLDPGYLDSIADYAWWVEKLVGVLDPICVGIGFRPYPADIGQRCIERLAYHFSDALSAGFSLASQRIAVALPATCVKPSVSVEANGDLRFGCEISRPSIGATAVGAALAR